MNNSITSREAILKKCRQLVSEKGLTALNMRAVAKACDVALGSLYYYFPSKNDLVIATIESVWEDIFKLNDISIKEVSFVEYIELTFNRIQQGVHKYPNFFTLHSISVSTNEQTKARASMDQYLRQIRYRLLVALRVDSDIRQSVFSEEFTEEQLVNFVLSNIVSILIQGRTSCHVLLEVIRRSIY